MRYEKRKKVYGDKLDKLSQSLKKVEMVRLAIVAMTIALVLVGYFLESDVFMIASIVAGIAVFIIMIILTNKLKDSIQKYKGLVNVYDMASARLDGRWTEFDERGDAYIDRDHRYTWDLDIFGKASLFQFLNVSGFTSSKDRLSELLRGDINFTQEEINNRQVAIVELSKKSWFREKLQGIDNRSVKTVDSDISKLLEWLHFDSSIYDNPIMKAMVFVLPVIFCISLIYGFIIKSFIIPFALFILHTIIIGVGYKKRDKVLKNISSYNDTISIYKDILYHIEGYKFNSEYLIDLQNKLKTNGVQASQHIECLNKLTNSISNRENAYFLILNVCFLRDIYSMIKINAWKDEIKEDFNNWIKVIAEFQVLTAFGFMKYDNPDWCMPRVSIKDEPIVAQDIGHPLISKGRVGNDFSMQNPTKVMLITGSNMAGKSTFLRSVSINMVLGNIGSCVCAKRMKYTRLPIYTCMRVSDNLKRNVSSFFYELLRIKNMNEVAKNSKIFFVLDEIFKGTNSYDRHYGAQTIIKHFIDYGSIGMVSTHDLELGELENELDYKLRNYSFSEDYLDDEIIFDYKMKEGISTTRNARKLMEMLGLLR